MKGGARRIVRLAAAGCVGVGLVLTASGAVRAWQHLGGLYSAVADDPMGETLDNPDAEGAALLGIVTRAIPGVVMLVAGTVVWRVAGRMR